MKVKVRPQAAKYIERLDSATKRRILKAICRLSEDPPRGDIKKMAGLDSHRLRVGGFRILFTIENGEISVDKIGPRGDVYKGGR